MLPLWKVRNSNCIQIMHLNPRLMINQELKMRNDLYIPKDMAPDRPLHAFTFVGKPHLEQYMEIASIGLFHKNYH